MSKELRLDNWKTNNSIFENSKLKSSEKFVAIAILKHRNIYSFKCCPSLGTLTKITGYSRRTIQTSITQLEKKNIIKRVKLMNEKRVDHTLYFFLDDIEMAKEISEDEESFINKSVQYGMDLENFEFALKALKLDN